MQSRLELFSAGIGITDDGDCAIEFDCVSTAWRLVTNATGISMATLLGGVAPTKVDAEGMYHIPIHIPHTQPLAGFAWAQERLGEQASFTVPWLYYGDPEDKNVEVVITLRRSGLLVRCNLRKFDNEHSARIAAAISEQIGDCTAIARQNGLIRLMLDRPADNDYNALLDFCHRVAEIVYTTP